MVPIWREAAREILDLTETPVAKVAGKVGTARAITHRHLSGKRGASVAICRKINAAIGSLLADPGVTKYLNSILAFEFVESTEGEWREAIDMALECCDILQRFLRPGSTEIITSRIDALPRPSAVALIITLNMWRRRNLIRHIEGRVSENTSAEELLEIFRDHGIDLDFLKVPEFEVLVAEERLYLEISRALAEATNDLQLRNRLNARIEKSMSAMRKAELRFLARTGEQK